MKHKSFVVFILSHGRAGNVKTLNTLKRSGYTGKTIIVIDNEDIQEYDYRRIYGDDSIYVFDKSEVAADTMDNFKKRNIVLYARNKIFDIAKELGYEYFLMLDDDYTIIDIRYVNENKLKHEKIKKADMLFDFMIDFLESSGALTVCLSQSGDYIGGVNGSYIYKGLSRKAMNSFFCKTDTPFEFYGTINEDVNMYVLNGMQGKKIFSITNVAINQTQTQLADKGLTDVYLDLGTYVKSFYSVMIEPSCVHIGLMGGSKKGMRIHHEVDWERCVPKIISDRYKK